MKAFSKALIGTAAAGAMALASASPAMARDRDRDRGGIDGGDILAGALVIGGIAAMAAAASGGKDRYDDRYDRRYDDRYDRRYDDRYDSRYDDRYDRRDQRRDYRRSYQQDAVDLCVRAAENTASRYNYGTRAQVTQIRDVDRERNGFEVKGRIAVQERGRNYRRDRWDEGKFTCEVRRGRVVDLDYSGIRGL